MSEFRGFKCDGCKRIIENPQDRTKQRVRFEHTPSDQNDDFYRDLCPACTRTAKKETKDTMVPVPQRRRRTRAVSDSVEGNAAA